MEKLLEPLRPLIPEADAKPFRAPIAMLTGCAVSLYQCFILLDGKDRGPVLREYLGESLFDELAAATATGDQINWFAGSHLRLHGVGFFLNCAQHRVAAPLDTCLGIG